ncbi:hypothetical protein JZ751_013322 [Albula glossodonta]|uniref:CARD domain-containing protein n=1 Tax=Albula glossodonta TaxID=121402 RepID=A0A8T2NUW3_9TELE|nr:hypothetical protein JZ751_013322 [Albula glossodonta]
MKSSGELEYSIVNWDTNLLTPTGLQPAGPLFSIDCPQESLRELGLPHCEILSVDCSSRMSEVSLYLIQQLPISPRQVKAQKRPQTNIETISNCHLTPGKMYSISCSLDRGHQIQPTSARFDDDYGPNYHPTFEMFLDLDVKKMNLRLLERNIEETEVWASLVILKGAATKQCSVVSPAVQFVDQHRAELIQRVPTVEPVADNLLSQSHITREECNKITAAQTSQQKMRLIYDFLDCGGDTAKSAFYTILRKEAPHLVQDLGNTVFLFEMSLSQYLEYPIYWHESQHIQGVLDL